MNKIKIIISYLLGIVLSISLFTLAMLFIVKNTVSNKSFMFRLMDENNYYTSIYNSINEDISDYMMSSGLESEVMDGVIDKNTVHSDIVNYINSFYKGKKYNVDTSKIHTTLRSNIDKYLKELNLGIDNTNELDLFINDIEKIYKDEVSFYNTIDRLSSYIVKANNLINKVLIINIIVVAILLILIIVLRSINIGSSILSGGLILFLVKLFIYERIDTQNILIVSDYFSLIIRSMFKYISNYMISISIVLICIGIILSLFKITKKND